jgi:glycosyltransferase involved in cell wall biosynthesis
MTKILTIGIPTYNRKSQLLNTLNNIFKNDLTNVEEILIIDNNSDYDLNSVVSSFDKKKIRIIKNNHNIGQAVNISLPFLHCKTKWLWLLSDDDLVIDSAISNIFYEINKSLDNTVMIKFDINRNSINQTDYSVNSLEDFIDYYHSDNEVRTGDLVFMSTNVYNLDNLDKYLIYAFEYAYTYIGYIIPIFMALNKNNYSVKFSSLSVVKYQVPENWGWSFPVVGKGLSTLGHIPLELNLSYRKKFLEITSLISYRSIILNFVNSEKNFRHISIADFKIIYDNSYKYYLPIRSKLICLFFIYLMSNNFTSKIVLKTLSFYKK